MVLAGTLDAVEFTFAVGLCHGEVRSKQAAQAMEGGVALSC